MKTAPTADSKPVALEFRKSLLACFAAKEQANEHVLSSIAVKAWEACGKRSRSMAVLAAPIHQVRLIHRGKISVLAWQAGDPIPPKIGFGLWKRGTLRPESVAGK